MSLFFGPARLTTKPAPPGPEPRLPPTPTSEPPPEAPRFDPVATGPSVVILGVGAGGGLHALGTLIGSRAATRWRNRTKARMISTLTGAALDERNTLESIAMPCSVNARGSFRRPPRPVLFDVTDCDIKTPHSSPVSRRAKSSRARTLDVAFEVRHPCRCSFQRVLDTISAQCKVLDFVV